MNSVWRVERGEIGWQSVLTRGDYLDGAWEAQRPELPTRGALAEVEMARGRFEGHYERRPGDSFPLQDNLNRGMTHE